MLANKNEKGKCPLAKFKECREDCVLYRKGTRVNDLTNEVFPIELCAFNVIADNIEAMHNRTFMLQKEMGETKNVMAFHVLANMGVMNPAEAEAQAKKVLLPVIEEIRKKELEEK
jgi:hypothetical protein